MRHFRFSIFITIICLGVGYYWGLKSSIGAWGALTLTLLLGIMEVSLSFDNAVVNASVLKEMNEKWRRLFLTVGILIAVFGMRLVFPIAVVAVAAGEGVVAVSQMALTNPEEYAAHLASAHAGIASFGGMFLLLVFLSFLLDEGKEIHWLGRVEAFLSKLGKFDAFSIVVALGVLLLAQAFLPLDMESRLSVVVAGIGGVFLYVVVDSVGSFFGGGEDVEAMSNVAKRSGAMGFIYLEVLDASFSFDGVIGAFAITRDVVIIMLGLGIGAMFVRSFTVYLVEQGTLDQYVFLEHGAHYAIGALAVIMMGSIVWHISEVITGLIGVAFIVASIISSLIYRRKNNPLPAS